MNQKQIGIILVIIGLMFSGFTYFSKLREDEYIRFIMQQNNGSCFLDDGTCLHADRTFMLYVVGGVLSLGLVMLGTYLLVFDKTQRMIAENQIKIAAALREAGVREKDKDRFEAFLAGFSEDEQKVLKAVREQEGILQSTLRYRTGLSKTGLSLLLASLEERGTVKRISHKKSKKVFLKKY